MNDWKMAALGDVCDVTAGGTPSRANPSYFGGGIPWVKIGDMLQGTVTVTEETITQDAINSSAAKLLPAGTVLISIFATIGRTAVLGVDAATNQAIAGITPRNPKCLTPEFLRRYLNSVVSNLERRARGVAQVNINSGILRALPLPLPPLSVQRRIAEILDKADGLRSKRRSARDELDALTESIFLDMFGAPARNPKDWPITSLANVLESIRNGANPEQTAEAEGWPITRIETIAEGKIDPRRVRWITPADSLLPRFLLQPGDILFSHINSVDHIGKTALYTGQPDLLIHGINLLRLRPKPGMVHPTWLLHLLKHQQVREYFRMRCKRAVNQASLNQQDIGALKIFLPPIEMQADFVSHVAEVAELEMAHSLSLSQSDSLFASLQHRAFRGEL